MWHEFTEKHPYVEYMQLIIYKWCFNAARMISVSNFVSYRELGGGSDVVVVVVVVVVVMVADAHVIIEWDV